MTVTQRDTMQETTSPGIRPFRIDVPEADLDELRQRLAATRWSMKFTRPDVDCSASRRCLFAWPGLIAMSCAERLLRSVARVCHKFSFHLLASVQCQPCHSTPPLSFSLGNITPSSAARLSPPPLFLPYFSPAHISRGAYSRSY